MVNAGAHASDVDEAWLAAFSDSLLLNNWILRHAAHWRRYHARPAVDDVLGIHGSVAGRALKRSGANRATDLCYWHVGR